VPSKREQIQKLLKGIETGDPEAATVVNESKYIQHNPRTGEGSEGLAVLFARSAVTELKPPTGFVRVAVLVEFCSEGPLVAVCRSCTLTEIERSERPL